MDFNFDPQAKYFKQAKQILEIFLREKYPAVISDNDVTFELITYISECLSADIQIDLMSDDILREGSVDWSLAEIFGPEDEKILQESCRRAKWLYDGKKDIKFDIYFVSRILKIINDVGVEVFMRDFFGDQ